MSTLYVIATPIGNLEDITYRAVRILGEVDALACEDTRHTRILFQKNEIQSPKIIFSYHDHNESRASERILGLLEQGLTVGLCSDAGYPGISDPGYRIISKVKDLGYNIEIIPGASAVPIALLSSGLPTSSYTFKGFPPRKRGQKKRFFDMEKDLPHTLIFFESPYRVGTFLEDALEVFGNRMCAVCVELTKKFEKIHKGYISELHAKFKDVKKIKGEITIVIAGNNDKFTSTEEYTLEYNSDNDDDDEFINTEEDNFENNFEDNEEFINTEEDNSEDDVK